MDELGRFDEWKAILAELVDVVFGPVGDIGFMAARVEEFFRETWVMGCDVAGSVFLDPRGASSRSVLYSNAIAAPPTT